MRNPKFILNPFPYRFLVHSKTILKFKFFEPISRTVWDRLRSTLAVASVWLGPGLADNRRQNQTPCAPSACRSTSPSDWPVLRRIRIATIAPPNFSPPPLDTKIASSESRSKNYNCAKFVQIAGRNRIWRRPYMSGIPCKLCQTRQRALLDHVETASAGQSSHVATELYNPRQNRPK